MLAPNVVTYLVSSGHVTVDESEEIALEELSGSDEKRFVAACSKCGTLSKFEGISERSPGDAFEHHCATCGSWREDLGNTQRFRVTDVPLDSDGTQREIDTVPVYSSSDGN